MGGLLVRGHPGLSVTDRVSISASGEPAPSPIEAKDRPGRAWVVLDHSATWPRGLSVPFPPGYGFLPPAQAEMLARQQELLRKQNLAR